MSLIYHRSALSQKSFPPSPSKEQIDAAVIQGTISNHAHTAITFGRRLIKYSLISALAIAATIAGACEATHAYVEHRSLAPETDEEVKKYQWDLVVDRWWGNANAGGTDPGMGYSGRHLVRSAWMAQTWGIGERGHSVSSEGYFGKPETVPRLEPRIAEPELLAALNYLNNAIVYAQTILPRIHPQTIPELIHRSASLVEKMGDNYLPDAKHQLEMVWDAYSVQGLDSARVALKLGDITFRLGEQAEALKWWKTAIQLCQDDPFAETNKSLLLPSQAPASPLAQRVLASTLVSLSAFYAQSGKLKEAETFEKSVLSFLRSIPHPESLASASPPQALHALYLLQRSSLISIHLAEVLYSEKQPVTTSIQWLTSAAESSERVVRALAGLPVHSSGKFNEEEVLEIYTLSQSMHKPAVGLLRDSRRTAAEAWNLLGVLYETKDGEGSKMAHECYARAIQWASKSSSKDGLEINEGTTESDWNVFWNNYQRTKSTENK